MTSNAANSYLNALSTFAAEAALPWVPVAVNGDQVDYSYDIEAQRTPPEAFLKLENTPLTAEGMFGDAVAGYEFDIAGTKLVRDWSKLQRTINGVALYIEKNDESAGELVAKGMRGKGAWRSMAPEIFGDTEFDLKGIGDADIAFAAMLLGKKYPTYMAMGVGYLESSAFRLLSSERFDMAAMLLELGANTRISFSDNMERIGPIVAHALLGSIENSPEPMSHDLLLARGIWYAWFDESGYTLEEFHKASLKRENSEMHPMDLIADNLGIVEARLRREKLHRKDWIGIWERVGNVARLLDRGIGADRDTVKAADKLAEKAVENAEAA